MKYNHQDARCLFIDGPLAVYVSEAPEGEILDALRRINMLVKIAAGTFPKRLDLRQSVIETVGDLLTPRREFS